GVLACLQHTFSTHKLLYYLGTQCSPLAFFLSSAAAVYAALATNATTMDDFNFGEACALMAVRQVEEDRDLDEEWNTWLPVVLEEEVTHASKILTTLGLRSLSIIQRRICRRLWERFFADEPAPWPHKDTLSFGRGEGMTYFLISAAASTASRRKITAALRIIDTNELDTETCSQIIKR
ncbi:hypothetical protein F5Y08DRAFT_109880, partial [Xylaria arbuscula]